MNFRDRINKLNLSELKTRFRDRWKSLVETAKGLQQSFKQNFPRNLEDLKKLQTSATADKLRRLASGKAYGTYVRLGAAAFAAYFLADTVSLFTDSLIPDPPVVPPPPLVKKEESRKTVDEYASITSRNIFSSKNIIPEDGALGLNEPARKTTLPLNLIGTVVLRDELKSIATIEDKSQNMVFPLRIDDTLDGKIQITKIEHLRVEFINKSSGRKEFIEIVEDLPTLNMEAARPIKTTSKGSDAGINMVDDTHVSLDRGVIDKALVDLPKVLQDARAIPNFDNGMPDGYKIIQIVPDSIFDKFGIKNFDVITGLNGEPINDPGKAMQVLNELRTQSHVELKIKRGGKTMTMNYDIR
jgi:general secretion pathway protein C